MGTKRKFVATAAPPAAAPADQRVFHVDGCNFDMTANKATRHMAQAVAALSKALEAQANAASELAKALAVHAQLNVGSTAIRVG